MSLSKIYIDKKVIESQHVASIISRLNIPFSIVSGPHEVYEAVSAFDDTVQAGKDILFLTRNRGSFIRKCPGTRNYTCCGYMILHIGTFCCMDCSYCVLQSYFHPPVLQYFVNHNDMRTELDKMFHDKKIRRIGTGEFTDSMIWESWTDLSGMLVPMFSKQSHTVLELKTKTTSIKRLKQLKHNRKTILSWSLNTDRVIIDEERHTSPLQARLKAAAKCESWGYPVAFHFDPVMIYDGCEEEYQGVINQIFRHVSPDNIVWISIGSFRFMPALKPVIKKRFPNSKIIYGEFIQGLDAKMRYFKPLRINLYKKIISGIRENAPKVVIYFCMEDDEVWEKSLGFIPSDIRGLPEMLDKSAVRICGLDD